VAEPVAGARLAEEIAHLIGRLIVLPPHADVAVTLWILHAHTHDSFEISPILTVQSPTNAAVRHGSNKSSPR
jgi:hypothetical protein